jgi:hypothetical protein
MNIVFDYMYRDGSNYKQGGEVVFSNPDKLTVEEIEGRIKAAIDEETYFIAHQIGVPEVFFDDLGEDDHSWHEFCGVRETRSRKNMDKKKRTIKELVEQMEQVEKWNEWNLSPAENNTVDYALGFLRKIGVQVPDRLNLTKENPGSQ